MNPFRSITARALTWEAGTVLRLRTLLVAGAICGSSVLGITTPVAAATCADPGNGNGFPSIANSLTVNSGCEIGTTNNDSQSQVNTDSMFNITDWVAVPGGGDQDTTTGTWNLGANFFDTYDAALIVLKGGASANTIPNLYVGYLVLTTSGDWESPFRHGGNGSLKTVSHLSIYGWIDPNSPNPGADVPLPGALVLMGTVLAGAGGIGAWRRRKRAV